MPGLGHCLRRQLLRLLATVPCPPMLVRAAKDHLAEGYWRTPSVDGKRPYGNFTNYPVEMVQAQAQDLHLPLPLHRQADGKLAITPTLRQEMQTLRQQTMAALQVFVRQVELMRNTLQ